MYTLVRRFIKTGVFFLLTCRWLKRDMVAKAA